MSKNYYRKLLEDGFTACKSLFDGTETRHQFLSEHIFEFITYDSGVSEDWGRRAVDVCRALTDKTTFEYIEDRNNYEWFLLMCNLPFFAERITWGTSIRGAWWDCPTTLSSCGLWTDDGQVTETLSFKDDGWDEFMGALIEFAEAT